MAPRVYGNLRFGGRIVLRMPNGIPAHRTKQHGLAHTVTDCETYLLRKRATNRIIFAIEGKDPANRGGSPDRARLYERGTS